MQGLIKISEAVSLAFHSMYVLAKYPTKHLSIQDISKTLSVSSNHLAKVLQRLTKAGFVESVRGPKGGFKLGMPAHKITLFAIYEAIQGRVRTTTCLLDKPVCSKGCCLLGELLHSVDKQVLDHFKNSTLANFIV